MYKRQHFGRIPLHLEPVDPDVVEPRHGGRQKIRDRERGGGKKSGKNPDNASRTRFLRMSAALRHVGRTGERYLFERFSLVGDASRRVLVILHSPARS